ncbi:MAG: transposase zinc-binding domain-containing protein, partial [Firmicutes bacterium]|nr:transposase zinc-binding domain-containing protein [Bacillota bacterium]
MVEVQDIFSAYGEQYRQTHNLPISHLKAISAIERCRTVELGGHIDVCDECGATRSSYNSCRNRHCPKCQTLTK